MCEVWALIYLRESGVLAGGRASWVGDKGFTPLGTNGCLSVPVSFPHIPKFHEGDTEGPGTSCLCRAWCGCEDTELGDLLSLVDPPLSQLTINTPALPAGRPLKVADTKRHPERRRWAGQARARGGGAASPTVGRANHCRGVHHATWTVSRGRARGAARRRRACGGTTRTCRAPPRGLTRDRDHLGTTPEQLEISVF